MFYWVVIGCMLILLGLWSVRPDSNKRTKLLEKAFSGRVPLAVNDFYNQFFKTQDIPFYVVDGVG